MTSAGTSSPPPARRAALTFDGDPDPRMNLVTGTVALPGGVPDGLTYTVSSAVDPDRHRGPARPRRRSTRRPHRGARAAAAAGAQPGRRPRRGPRAGVGPAGGDPRRVRRPGLLRRHRRHRPGHSYGRIAAMLEDPDRIVGFEEQYAAAAAVMAQVAELPVRVVVGYEIPPDAWQGGSAEVTASDISAWVEIDAGELGWIPVDVTPDRSRTPDPDSQGSTTEQVAIPNPPPPPPPPPQIEPPRQEEDEIDSDDEAKTVEHEFAADTGLAAWAVVAVGVAGVPLTLLVLFALVVIAWKLVRRARRRRRASTTARVAGAWAEAVDRCTETGAPRLDRHDTPRDGRRVRRRPGARHRRRGRCGGWPTRSTGRRSPPAPRATSTPTAPGRAATRSPPSSASTKPSLLILDELGYLHIDKAGADLLFQVISLRYGQGSIMITLNRAYSAPLNMGPAVVSTPGRVILWPHF